MPICDIWVKYEKARERYEKDFWNNEYRPGSGDGYDSGTA